MPDWATYHNFPEEPDGPGSVTVISPKSPPVYETSIIPFVIFGEFMSFSEIYFQVSRILQGQIYLFLKYL